MTSAEQLPDSVIKLAVMAVGGQGGGVLTTWIETLARGQGYACQATSVAGVAQRTGATIYYIEMAPAGAGKAPVFSLAPSAGDVDILIAAELMEAGRAIMRGFVTPDKTTLIASTHRTLAISEKMVPGDGVSDPAEVMAAAEIAAARMHCFDMEALAVANNSAISATLLGALAGTACLPFSKDAFQAAIRQGGKGVEASLRAFEAGFERCQNGVIEPRAAEDVQNSTPRPIGASRLVAHWSKLEQRVDAMPAAVRPMALAGLRKTVGFMDLAYGEAYLDHLGQFLPHDDEQYEFELSIAAAKYIANAMAYDDVIRVADLKTRSARVDRIADEMGADKSKVMKVTEFLHPRAEEIVGLLPKRLGGRLEQNPRLMARIDRWFGKGRRMRSDRALPFLMLYLLGGLKKYRRKTHRHAIEQQHLAEWIRLALDHVGQNYALGTEILRCRRLIKGYSDTHARGLSKFDRTLDALHLIKDRPDAADWLRRLREAALLNENGDALAGAIETIKTI